MSKATSIEWCDATWNPIRGCSRVSEGCRHCYAETVAARFSGPGLAYDGITRNGKWTGEVRFIEEHLDDPLKWRKPRRVFVNSMSDLFHEEVDAADIDRIFDVMMEAPQHTYQILTKRPARMRDYVARWLSPALTTEMLRHVWLGVSVEDQATADERIPLLIETPAVTRWISYEPALDPVSFATWLPIRWDSARREWQRETVAPWVANRDALHWIVVGGESGRGARLFHLEWARSTIKQCRAARVPVFVKQLGTCPCSREIRDLLNLTDRKGGDMAEWPDDLRVREFPA